MTDQSGKIPLTNLAGTKWWDIDVFEGPSVGGKKTMEAAIDLYEETLCDFEDLMKKDTEQQWLRKVIKSGTHSDQLAALVTLTQMAPILSLPHVKQLLNLAQVKAVRITEPALGALKRLFVEDLLPPTRKLHTFAENAATETPKTKIALIVHYFEDFVKKAFATFVQLLFDAQTSSPIESTRNAVSDYAYDLLAFIKGAHATGEQERPLLKLLVKSFNDKSLKRVSAKGCLLVKKLATVRPHLKEVIVDDVRDQYLLSVSVDKKKKVGKSSGPKISHVEITRGLSLSCSLFASTFPLNEQDDVYVASKIVKILSELINRIISGKGVKFDQPEKKNKFAKSPTLAANSGMSEAEVRLLRLCLQGLERAFAVAGSDCPVPETTNSLLVKLCHETTVPGLSIAILNFLHRVSSELKTDSPKLLRSLYSQLAVAPTYTSAQLPYLLSLVKKSVVDNTEGSHVVSEQTRIAFKRRLVQVSLSVSEPIVAVIMALVQPVDLEQRLREIQDEETIEGSKFGYNPQFWDPTKCGSTEEPNVYELSLLRHHYMASVRTGATAEIVEAPKEPPSLAAQLVDVSTMTLEENPKKKQKKVDIDDVPIEETGPMPGL